MAIFPPGFNAPVPQTNLPPFDPDIVYRWQIEGAAVTQIKGSTEEHRIDVSGEKRNGGYLTGAEIASAGIEMCFLEDASDLDNTGSDAPLWYALSVDTTNVAGTHTRAYAFLDVGPQAIPEIAKADTYSRYVRVIATPHVIKKIGDFTVSPE